MLHGRSSEIVNSLRCSRPLHLSQSPRPPRPPLLRILTLADDEDVDSSSDDDDQEGFVEVPEGAEPSKYDEDEGKGSMLISFKTARGLGQALVIAQQSAQLAFEIVQGGQAKNKAYKRVVEKCYECSTLFFGKTKKGSRKPVLLPKNAEGVMKRLVSKYTPILASINAVSVPRLQSCVYLCMIVGAETACVPEQAPMDSGGLAA
eukprot:2808270-Rhodomonas_salina.1